MAPVYVGIDVSKDRLDVHVRPSGQAFAVARGIEGLEAIDDEIQQAGGYAMAKAALESLAFTYAAECEGTKVKVNVLNPGPVRTSMRAQAMPGEDPLTLPTPEDLAPLIVKMLSAEYVSSGELVTFRK